ncbi:TraX family protein [Carnobacterium gallinarum]|uniref:TraX family protein n=1 Tax=Carnobacterium gallinarum TaxID=2749 RepID=UPI0005595B4D|nr:TraX family protein [Carnobacterium gallinarum]
MTGTALKFLMAFLMVFDHIGYFVSPEVQSIFHVLTRCVGVFFAYMAVEGFHYTHDRKAYLKRLFGMAAVMFVGNSLLSMLINDPLKNPHNNIFLTLALGTLMLYFMSLVKQQNGLAKKVLLIIGSIVILLGSPFLAEGGQIIVPFMLLSYMFYEKPAMRNLSYLLFAGILFFMSYSPYPTIQETIEMLAFNSDFMFITVIPFLYLYNGKRGNNSTFSKYFFYGFYPAHLWIIALAAAYL